LLQALAFAFLAAAAARVEREAARGPAAHPSFGRICKQPAYLVPEAHIGGGAGARRLADRRLVHFEHALDVLLAFDALAADGRFLDQRLIEDTAGERGLARARDAGHGDQPAE